MRRGIVWLLVVAFGASSAARAAEVRISRAQSKEAFLEGTLDGVSVDPLGTLRLAARAERLAAISEPFVLSAATHPDGWVVGTGNDGRVLLVRRSGELEELFVAAEPEVFAVWVDARGTVFAGTSPNGRVYRLDESGGSELFNPEETYIWALRGLPGGDLLVATGTQGRLYRVSPRGDGSVLWDSDDTHLRALEVLPDGGILVGTAGEGLIVRIDPTGHATTLYDAAQPEIVGFALGPDGRAYAAAVASEASQVDLSASAQSDDDSAEDGEEEEPETAQVVVEEVGADTVGSRPSHYSGARSELLAIAPGGGVESLTSLDADTVFSLIWRQQRLWIGTGLEGKVYSWADHQLVLENDLEERQVVALVSDGDRPAFVTTNAGAFFRLVDSREPHGTYQSPVLDAGGMARYGSLTWRGREPDRTSVQFALRSGMSAEPDGTWSPWTASVGGASVDLAGLPEGRFFQWRAELSGKDDTRPTISSVEVSYRQQNLPPRILTLEVLEPGQVLVPANFNPSNQIYEPAHPNRDGIFDTLEASPEDSRLKQLWKKSYLTLRWTASDPNRDPLRYDLSFLPEGESGGWMPMDEDLSETHYSFDSSVLPDGVYRFHLVAIDRQANGPGEELSSERTSEPVVVDHAPPALLGAKRQGTQVSVEVADDLNPVREAVYSVDAGPWKPALPVDGLLDGRRERLLLEVPSGARLVLLRLTDAAFNVESFDIARRVEAR